MLDPDMEICRECGQPAGLCYYGGRHPESPIVVMSDQIVRAITDLDRAPSSYLRWPWDSLDSLYGGMAPGTLHYVVGFSGLGKSTFIASAIGRWIDRGLHVDVMPLEVSSNMFRTYLACQDVGVDPGLMLSGDFWRRDDADDLRERVKNAVRSQLTGAWGERCYVHGVRQVTAAALRNAAEAAANRGAQILVIDHIDHIEGDGERRQSLYEASRQVNREALRVAQSTGLVIIAMSQANNEALSGNANHLAKYAPLRDNHVLMGGHKRQDATGMLSLYRPLLPCPEGGDAEDIAEWKATLKAARDGDATPQTALEPGACGVSLMKSRTYGGREGSRISLTWQAGRIVDRVALPYSLRRLS